jgi:hypothetical protein
MPYTGADRHHHDDHKQLRCESASQVTPCRPARNTPDGDLDGWEAGGDRTLCWSVSAPAPGVGDLMRRERCRS